MKHSITAALLATTMLLPATVLAQASPATPAAETSDEGVIVVTARKREENLQEVPLSITALGAETLQASRVENLADVAKLTPGLTFTPLFGRQNQLPIIRGAAQTFGQLNVGVFLDGVYLSGKAAVDLELNDLERVEVIKGPQSALYGRNTFAGAINYVTQRPTAKFTARGEATYGSDNLFKVLASVSGPISDTLRARVGGYYRSFDGFYTSSIDGGRVDFDKAYGATGTLEWAPTDAFTATLRATYAKDKGGQPASNVIRTNAFPAIVTGSQVAPIPGVLPGGFAGSTRDLLFIGQVPSIPRNGVTVNTTGLTLVPGQTVTFTAAQGGGTAVAAFPAIRSYGDNEESIRASATFEYDFGSVLGTAISSYSDRQLDYTLDGDNTVCDRTGGCPNFGFPLAPAIPLGTSQLALSSAIGYQRDWSQELRFQSSGRQTVEWLFGLFYYHSTNTSIDRSSGPTQAAANIYGFPSQTLKTDSYAVFGSVNWHATDALTFSAELRYEYEKQRFEQSPTNPGVGRPSVINPQTTPALTGVVNPASSTGAQFTAAGSALRFDLGQDFRFLTPRFIVNYKLGAGNIVYASYARGAKTGGFNSNLSLFFNQRTYQPEFTDNFEVGVKTSFAGGRGRFNVAGYYNDWQDQQAACQNPVDPINFPGAGTTQRTYTCNVAAARIYGAEFDGSFAFTDWFSIGANYAYTNAKYKRFVDASLAAALTTLGQPAIDFKNKSLPYVPQHKFVVSPQIDVPLGERASLQLISNISYQSKSFVRADNLQSFGSVTLVDLRATLRFNPFYLQLFANNVFDNDTPTAGVRFFDSVNYSVASPLVTGANRRQIGASLGFKF